MASWKENKLVGIAVFVVLILTIGGIILVLQPKKIEMTLMCESTGEVMSMKLVPGVTFPFVNSKTGSKDLYPASKVKCSKCGWEGYVMKKPIKILTDEEVRAGKEGGEKRPRCPKCGNPL